MATILFTNGSKRTIRPDKGRPDFTPEQLKTIMGGGGYEVLGVDRRDHTAKGKFISNKPDMPPFLVVGIAANQAFHLATKRPKTTMFKHNDAASQICPDHIYGPAIWLTREELGVC